MNTTAPKAPTAAQVRLNHERATTAVARLNDKAWNGIRYELVADRLDQPAVIVKYVRPFGYENRDKPEQVALRYQTRIDQTIGWPVGYSNKYNASNHGTMCKGINDAEESRGRRIEALRRFENDVTRLERELTEAQERVARIKAELGL